MATIEDREDMNDVSLTGKVHGKAEVMMTPSEGLILTFTLTVSKIVKRRTNPSLKLSTFKVVLFNELAERHERNVVDGQCVLVKGELDETAYFGGGTTNHEFRVVGRFVKILGGA